MEDNLLSTLEQIGEPKSTKSWKQKRKIDFSGMKLIEKLFFHLNLL